MNVRLGSIFGLILTLAATCAGCGKDSGPTQPVESLRLTVLGSLTSSSESVSAFEAITSFDGAQVAYNHCDSPCRTLELRGPVRSTKGPHSVALQLVSQSCDPSPCAGGQPYRISGKVSVSDSSGAVIQEIPLAEKTVQLRGTDVVTYPIDVNP